jgi:hypothetical protein
MKILPIKRPSGAPNLQSQRKLTKITACHEVLSATIHRAEVEAQRQCVELRWTWSQSAGGNLGRDEYHRLCVMQERTEICVRNDS